MSRGTRFPQIAELITRKSLHKTIETLRSELERIDISLCSVESYALSEIHSSVLWRSSAHHNLSGYV